MMTMLTTRIHPRLRPLQTRTLVVPGASMLRPRPTVQTRAYRFDNWSFYLDPAYQRELRRRHQGIKRKCVEHINQRLPLSSHENPFAEVSSANFKRVLAQFRAPTQYGLRWVSQVVFESRKGVPPRASQYHQTTSSQSSQPPAEDSDPQAQDYVIDPITNRKVPKRVFQLHEAALEPPAAVLYKTQYAPFAPYIQEAEKRPVHSNGKPPPIELNKYAETEVDDWSATDPPTSVDTEDLPTQLSKYAEIEVDDWAATNTTTSVDAGDLSIQLKKYAEIEVDDWSATDTLTAAGTGNLSTQPSVVPRASNNSNPSDKEYSLNHLPLEEPFDTSNAERNSYLNPSSHSASEEGQLQNELQDYGPYTYNEGQSTTTDTQSTEDLEGYRYDASAEPENLPTEASTEYVNDLEKYEYDALDEPKVSSNPSTVYEDLDKYEYTAVVEPEAKEQPFEQYGDLEKYKVFRVHDLDSKVSTERDTVEESLKEFDDKEEEDVATFDTIDAYDSNASGNILKGDAPKDIEPTQNSFGMEAALNFTVHETRNIHSTPTLGVDFYSKDPQGIETSFAEEHGGKHTMPLYTSQYHKKIDQAMPESLDPLSELYCHRDPEIDGIPSSEPANLARNQKPVQSDEPTLYKVLAYNPTMQTIDVVETSSAVADQAIPLSPTEVLPRLSNPTKFFPYFARLHAEGFEIVSGSGDVLVFRQVRPAAAASQSGVMHVNPIDLMGRSIAVPNAAAFVSPTGFLNYDVPQDQEGPVDAVRTSNVNVRREEPVFSGQKSSSRQEKAKKPRMNAAKRALIGGVSVASMSYALGVVGEYFTTGGADGSGPSGFSPV